MVNHYDVLGISRGDTEAKIRKAYRRLARKYHPDVNPNDKEAEARFKEINEAYQVLSDPETRKKYDRHGENWKQADRVKEAQAARSPFARFSGWGGEDSIFGGAAGDIFSGVFSRVHGGFTKPAMDQKVSITLEEAYAGTTREIVVPATAQPWKERRLDVKIPAGVDNGSRVHVAYDDGHNRGFNLHIEVKPHRRFLREGNDLRTEAEVPLLVAVLGGEGTVRTIRSKVELKIPPETQNGQTFRLVGQGMPHLKQPKRYGDLFVKIWVAVPTGITEEERKLFEQLEELWLARS